MIHKRLIDARRIEIEGIDRDLGCNKRAIADKNSNCLNVGQYCLNELSMRFLVVDW